MDHARGLRDELEVEVFKANLIGRAFYAKYGFVLTQEKVHAETGFDVMRLKLAVNSPHKEDYDGDGQDDIGSTNVG